MVAPDRTFASTFVSMSLRATEPAIANVVGEPAPGTMPAPTATLTMLVLSLADTSKPLSRAVSASISAVLLVLAFTITPEPTDAVISRSILVFPRLKPKALLREPLAATPILTICEFAVEVRERPLSSVAGSLSANASSGRLLNAVVTSLFAVAPAGN